MSEQLYEAVVIETATGKVVWGPSSPEPEWRVTARRDVLVQFYPAYRYDVCVSRAAEQPDQFRRQNDPPTILVEVCGDDGDYIDLGGGPFDPDAPTEERPSGK